jgi:hypothetical protein
MMGRAIATHFQLQHPDLLTEMLELEPLADLHPNIPRIQVSHDDKPQWKHPQDIVVSKTAYTHHRVLLLVRDPRDVIVSRYFQNKYRIRDGKHIDGKPITAYDGDLSSYVREPGGNLERLLTFYNVWAENRAVPQDFLVVRYEDLHTEPEVQLGRSLQFAGLEGIPTTVLDEAVEFTAFDKMHQLEASGKLAANKLKPGNPDNPESYKTRQGKVGSYTQYLSEEDIEYIHKAMQRILSPTARELYQYE